MLRVHDGRVLGFSELSVLGLRASGVRVLGFRALGFGLRGLVCRIRVQGFGFRLGL